MYNFKKGDLVRCKDWKENEILGPGVILTIHNPCSQDRNARVYFSKVMDSRIFFCTHLIHIK